MKLALVTGLCLVSASTTGICQPQMNLRIDLEGGVTSADLNNVQIPSRGGTPFDVNGLQGAPQSPLIRASATIEPWARHGFQLTYQYLRTEGTGRLPLTTNFMNAQFGPGYPTTSHYRFDSWRATYRYTILDDGPLQIRVGVTGLLRDAEVRLTQGTQVRSNKSIGFVPLIHASFDYNFAPKFVLMGDVDGLGARQGHAVDLGLRLGYDIKPNWQITGGYRMLDGGVNNDAVSNTARFHTFVGGVAFKF